VGPCQKCGSNKRDKNLACAACGATPKIDGQVPIFKEQPCPETAEQQDDDGGFKDCAT